MGPNDLSKWAVDNPLDLWYSPRMDLKYKRNTPEKFYEVLWKDIVVGKIRNHPASFGAGCWTILDDIIPGRRFSTKVSAGQTIAREYSLLATIGMLSSQLEIESKGREYAEDQNKRQRSHLPTTD